MVTMQDLFKVLPDDRPITSVCVVEDQAKCPPGFTVTSRTYDQDADADLWKDGFLRRRITRYLCTSKTIGTPNYVIESLALVSERDPPPDGFTLITHTHDTEQRAWKKKQLCYKASPLNTATYIITDIIVLSRSKHAPEGFMSVGEVNGLLLCYKISKPRHDRTSLICDPNSNSAPGTPSHFANHDISSPTSLLYPGLGNGELNRGRSGSLGSGQTYGNASRPYHRAAPLPPVPNGANRNATLGATSGLEGVPFILNPKLKTAEHLIQNPLPRIVPKTIEQLDAEFAYDFRNEQDAVQTE